MQIPNTIVNMQIFGKLVKKINKKKDLKLFIIILWEFNSILQIISNIITEPLLVSQTLLISSLVYYCNDIGT